MDRPARWRRSAWLALPMLAAGLVYLGTLRGEFVYDDYHQIVGNHWVKELRFLPQLVSRPVWAFQTTEPTNYFRPIQMATYGLLWWASGGQPFAFHLLNVLLHAATAGLVALLVRRLAGDRLVAGGAALLFAVHPANTEAVAWIACLPELSYSLLGVAALLLHVSSWTAGPRAGGRRRLAWLAFALALFSKETALTLLALVFLLELWLRPEAADAPARRGPTAPARGGWLAAARAALPYALIGAAYLAVRWLVVGGLAPRARGNLTALDAVINAPALFLSYLRLLALPTNLLAYHIFEPLPSWAAPSFLLGLPAVLALALLALRLSRSRPDLSFAAALIALPLLPVLYVPAVGENAFAERYVYLSSAGFCWLLLAALRAAVRRLGDRRAALGGAVAAVLVLAVAGAAASVDRSADWRTDERLAGATLRDEPRAAHMFVVLGNWHERHDESARALAVWDRGLAANPGNPFLEASVITGELRLHRIGAAQAVARYRAIAERYPRLVDVWVNLGGAYMKDGRPAEAEAAFRRAVELDPNDRDAHTGLRLALLGQGRDTEHLPAPEGAALSASEKAAALGLEGIALTNAGRLDEAEQKFRQALRLDPGSATALVQLGALRGLRGDDREAIEHCRRAIAIDPGLVGAYRQIGISASRLGNREQAITALETAVSIDPADKKSLNDLGRVYALAGKPEAARRSWEAALALDPHYEEARSNLARLEQTLRAPQGR